MLAKDKERQHWAQALREGQCQGRQGPVYHFHPAWQPHEKPQRSGDGEESSARCCRGECVRLVDKSKLSLHWRLRWVKLKQPIKGLEVVGEARGYNTG